MNVDYLGVWLTRLTNIVFLINPVVLLYLFWRGRRFWVEFSIHDAAYIGAHVALFVASFMNHMCSYGGEPTPDNIQCPVSGYQSYWSDEIACVVALHACVMQRCVTASMQLYTVSVLSVMPVVGLLTLQVYGQKLGFLIFAICVGVLGISVRLLRRDIHLHQDLAYQAVILIWIAGSVMVAIACQYIITFDDSYFVTHSIWHVCTGMASLGTLFVFGKKAPKMEYSNLPMSDSPSSSSASYAEVNGDKINHTSTSIELASPTHSS